MDSMRRGLIRANRTRDTQGMRSIDGLVTDNLPRTGYRYRMHSYTALCDHDIRALELDLVHASSYVLWTPSVTLCT